MNNYFMPGNSQTLNKHQRVCGGLSGPRSPRPVQLVRLYLEDKRAGLSLKIGEMSIKVVSYKVLMSHMEAVLLEIGKAL